MTRVESNTMALEAIQSLQARQSPGFDSLAVKLSSLMDDVLAGRVDYKDANAVCNAASQLLKLIKLRWEMEKK